jgi:hypothetical protein
MQIVKQVSLLDALSSLLAFQNQLLLFVFYHYSIRDYLNQAINIGKARVSIDSLAFT